MPSLRDIRRRITSVKKTQQITRAMRMVAGAKLRRAEEAVVSARPYTDQMREALVEVARSQREVEHPLLAPHEELRRVELVVVSSDRGLCGAFNANVIKHAEALARERERAGQQVFVSCAGRKAAEFFRRRRRASMRSVHTHDGWVRYEKAAEIARELEGRYLAGESDEVVLVFNEFMNAMTQKPRAARLLPFAPPAAENSEAEAPLPYEIEPSPQALLATLVPRAVEVEVFRALLENQSGEHAARMTAMESATRNTEELISSLTLKFNRARQAAITKELVEIVSGAEAL